MSANVDPMANEWFISRNELVFRTAAARANQSTESDLHPTDVDEEEHEREERKVKVASETVIRLTSTDETSDDECVHGNGDDLQKTWAWLRNNSRAYQPWVSKCSHYKLIKRENISNKNVHNVP